MARSETTQFCQQELRFAIATFPKPLNVLFSGIFCIQRNSPLAMHDCNYKTSVHNCKVVMHVFLCVYMIDIAGTFHVVLCNTNAQPRTVFLHMVGISFLNISTIFRKCLVVKILSKFRETGGNYVKLCLPPPEFVFRGQYRKCWLNHQN